MRFFVNSPFSGLVPNLLIWTRVEDTMEVVALYGVGVVVRVPSPARYAVHKLIVAGRRDTTNPKCSKDLRQAQDLMSILSDLDEASLEDAIEDGRSKGRTWKTTINAALKSLGLQLHLDAKQLRS